MTMLKAQVKYIPVLFLFLFCFGFQSTSLACDCANKPTNCGAANQLTIKKPEAQALYCQGGSYRLAVNEQRVGTEYKKEELVHSCCGSCADGGNKK